MIVVKEDDDVAGLYRVKCPGCRTFHLIPTKDSHSAKWDFDGDMEKPTFSPSLKVTWVLSKEWVSKDERPGKNICHSFIRNGQWHFLNDCTHDLAGKTVGMISVNNNQS